MSVWRHQRKNFHEILRDLFQILATPLPLIAFFFKLFTIEDICNKILALDASKATQNNNMPTKVIKNNSDIFSKLFQAKLNNATETSTFPE